MKRIACLGDSSDHGGTLITTNQDDKFDAGSLHVCADQCQHDCPIHGVTLVTAITVKSYVNNKLIITEGAIAGCGAVIQPIDRKVYVE